jgi:hypothetical protein
MNATAPGSGALELRGVCKRYGTGADGQVTGADDVTFTIEAGCSSRFIYRFWGAIIVGPLSWLLSTTLGDKRHDREPASDPFVTSAPTGRSAGPPWPGPYGSSPHPG